MSGEAGGGGGKGIFGGDGGGRMPCLKHGITAVEL